MGVSRGWAQQWSPGVGRRTTSSFTQRGCLGAVGSGWPGEGEFFEVEELAPMTSQVPSSTNVTHRHTEVRSLGFLTGQRGLFLAKTLQVSRRDIPPLCFPFPGVPPGPSSSFKVGPDVLHFPATRLPLSTPRSLVV